MPIIGSIVDGCRRINLMRVGGPRMDGGILEISLSGQPS